MADLDITSNNLGGTRINLKQGQTISAPNAAIFQSIDTLDTYLLANGYTAASLAPLGKQDKVFAARIKLGLD